MTQPTSEALSERYRVLDESHTCCGIPLSAYITGAKRDYDGGMWTEHTANVVHHLLAALDQALARCEGAEKRVEELRGAGTQCAKLVAAWYAGEEWFTTDDAMAALRKWDAAQPEPDTGGV